MAMVAVNDPGGAPNKKDEGAGQKFWKESLSWTIAMELLIIAKQ